MRHLQEETTCAYIIFHLLLASLTLTIDKIYMKSYHRGAGYHL